ncbi:MAG TPA: PilZ domain-containing protein [Thermoanaerobaculia bacterium]|nr:PilZ domain-containing protein [Thermoanaerobaculia bacterium]
MTRRRAVRRPRRVQIQFWKRGEPHVYPGYTTNISTTGMFLATNSPQPPGTRLRIEVLEGDRGFMLEGMVAHARKIRGDMMRMSQPGMGVRFLAVEDLVRELIPVLPGETEEIPTGPDQIVFPSPGPPPPAVATPSTQTVPAPPPARPTEGGSGVFSVGFLGASEFLEIYQRDIVNGGLFVSTRYPGRLQETVRIELRPPNSSPVSVRARVVQRFEPQEGSFGPNLLSGMGVEILNLPAVLEELQPIVERLRG